MKLACVSLIVTMAAPLVALEGRMAASRPEAPSARQNPAAVLSKTCGSCHTPDRIFATRRSRQEWDEVIETMISKGAKVADEDYEGLMTYLLQQAGRVNANRAPAQDLIDVLTLSEEEASAVVKYRTTNGDFADFDALAKVPGVDVKKLESHREAIAF